MEKWLQDIEELKTFLFVDENDFLREKCSNLPLLDALIERGENIFWQYNGEDRMKVCGYLGNLHRLRGNYDVALSYLERYKDYCFENENHDKATVALLRYGEGLKLAREHKEALAIFEEVLERCYVYKLDRLEHYAWQHLGKCYFEMGDLQRAEKCFLKAYTLRKELNDQKLLAASETVLNFMLNLKK